MDSAKSAYHNDCGALSVKGEGWRVKAVRRRSIPFTLDPPPCTQSSQGLFDSCSKEGGRCVDENTRYFERVICADLSASLLEIRWVLLPRQERRDGGGGIRRLSSP